MQNRFIRSPPKNVLGGLFSAGKSSKFQPIQATQETLTNFKKKDKMKFRILWIMSSAHNPLYSAQAILDQNYS